MKNDVPIDEKEQEQETPKSLLEELIREGALIPGTIPGTPYFFKVSPLLELVDDWGRFIAGQIAERDVSLLRKHERTGRPLGAESFIDGLERALNRRLRKQKPGPKRNQ